MIVESPAHAVARLLTALEDLTGQETVLLRSGDVAGALRTQARAAPLVESLAGFAAAAGAEARARIAAIVDHRRESENWLATALARERDELQRLRISQRRLVQFRPAYGSATIGGQQLSALG